MLLTSSVNPFGVSNTLQIKVSLDIANVLTTVYTCIYSSIYIDMSRDDQMFSIFFKFRQLFKEDSFWQVPRHMKNIHQRRIQSHHLILILEWNPFSDAMIPAKVFLI